MLGIILKFLGRNKSIKIMLLISIALLLTGLGVQFSHIINL